jgi:hypothetical protein
VLKPRRSIFFLQRDQRHGRDEQRDEKAAAIEARRY